MISMMSTIGSIYPKGRKTLAEGAYKDNSENAGNTSAAHNAKLTREEIKTKYLKILKAGTDKTHDQLAKFLNVPRSTIVFWKKNSKVNL